MEGDGKLIWTYRDAMVPAVMPKSLLVIGSGALLYIALDVIRYLWP